jgi:hypothetical protein
VSLCRAGPRYGPDYQLAPDISTFYYAASHLTNGIPGWQLQSPVVESDLLTLAQECQGI